jgi:hypothetical protein
MFVILGFVAGCSFHRHAGSPVVVGHYRVVSPSVVGDYDGGPAIGRASPDGKWSVEYTRRNGWGNLDVTDRASPRTYRLYHSNDSCCSEITWLPPHVLIFDDDYKVQILDPTNRRVATIAHFSNFAVSHDGRWIAGYADSGGHAAETVGVVSSTNGSCRVVSRKSSQDDTVVTFTSNDNSLLVARRVFDQNLGEVTGSAQIVTVQLEKLQPHSGC